MASYAKVEIEKSPTRGLNTKINKDLLYQFKVKCKQRRIPLNLVIELFMNQYANGKYHLSKESIMKWKEDDGETGILNSTFRREVFDNFKSSVKKEGLHVKHVVAAFIEDYINNDLTLEFSHKEGYSNDCKIELNDVVIYPVGSSKIIIGKVSE